MTSQNPMDPQTNRFVAIAIAAAFFGGIAFLVYKKAKASSSPSEPVGFRPIPNAVPHFGPTAPIPVVFPVKTPIRSGAGPVMAPTSPVPASVPASVPLTPMHPTSPPAPSSIPVSVPASVPASVPLTPMHPTSPPAPSSLSTKEWIVLPDYVGGQKAFQKGTRYRISMPPIPSLAFTFAIDGFRNQGFHVLEAFDEHTPAPFDWPGQEWGAAWRFTLEWIDAVPLILSYDPSVRYYQEIESGGRFMLPTILQYHA